MKKILSVIIAFCLILSLASVSALAAPKPVMVTDINITEGVASSKETWTFDGQTLTLNGGNYGKIMYKDPVDDKKMELNIVTTADTKVYEIDHSGYWNITYKFTGAGKLTVGNYIHGAANGDEVLLDGANLDVQSISIGGSGFMGSTLSLRNGAKLVLGSKLGLSDVMAYDTSSLTVDAMQDRNGFTENALELNSSSNFTFEPTASLILKSSEAAVYANEGVDIVSILGLPASTKTCVYSNFGSDCVTLADAAGNPLKDVMLYAAAAPAAPNGLRTEEKDVNAKYIAADTTPTVYSVDVAWGKMEFTYTKTGTNDWNADKHTYVDNTVGTWTAEGNTISVTNHSNSVVTAKFSSTLNSGYKGNFDKTYLELKSAEGTAIDSAPSGSAQFDITSGTADTVEFSKIGTVTVEIIGGVIA